jgi:hypothetical protein
MPPYLPKSSIKWDLLLQTPYARDLTTTHLRLDTGQGLTVRPEPVEGWAVKPIMARQAHHERLNLKLFRLNGVADLTPACKNNILQLTSNDKYCDD